MERKVLYAFISGAILSAIGTLLGALFGVKCAEKEERNRLVSGDNHTNV